MWDITQFSPVKIFHVSEEHIVSIFRLEAGSKQSSTFCLLHMAYSYNLKMEAMFLRNICLSN
jgi:hypothetical protein